MSETQHILALRRRALARGEKLCLATVVHVEGSSYRKPGARMLLASGGERAGTISGGCLEAEVSRKAFWLTAEGPRVERYSSFAEEDGSLPYGLGCGGTVTLLLEQGPAVLATLQALERGRAAQQPFVLVAALSSNAQPGTLALIAPGAGRESDPGKASSQTPFYLRTGLPADISLDRLMSWATEALAGGRSFYRFGADEPLSPFQPVQSGTEPAAPLPAYFVEYLAPPPALTIFGAGDDAQPIAALAQSLGWRVSVADGRAHLARRDRFPQAASVRVLHWEQALGHADPGLRAACGLNAEVAAGEAFKREPSFSGPDGAAGSGGAAGLASGAEAHATIESDALAIILTHSYEQDRALLAALLPRNLDYLGILGPRHRTERLLGEIAPSLGLTLDQAFARLHSPVGLDLGAGDPASVALSILAQIQAVLHRRRVTITRDAESGGGLAWTEASPEASPDSKSIAEPLAEACRG